MSVSKRVVSRFARALRMNNTGTVRATLVQHPDIALRTMNTLYASATEPTKDEVMRYVATASPKHVFDEFLDRMINYYADYGVIGGVFRLCNSSRKRHVVSLISRDYDNVCRCLHQTVQTEHLELFTEILKHAKHGLVCGVVHTVCAYRRVDMLRLLIDHRIDVDYAMQTLCHLTIHEPSTPLDLESMLIRAGSTAWDEWFELVSRATLCVQTSRDVVETSMYIFEKTEATNVDIPNPLIRVLLEAGLPRDRLCAPPEMLAELDAARSETREACIRHMPNVLCDVVADYLP